MKQETLPIPTRCALGLAGALDFSEIRAVWPPASPFDIRGRSERFVSPGGWEIFVLGQAACARSVGAVLDRHLGSASRLLTAEDARQLAWTTLPSSAIVAVHPGEGRACLIRDPCGFRPLYYVWRDNRLVFSSNLPHLRSMTEERGINTDKISEMLVYGHRAGCRTIWQGVNMVGAGRLIEFRKDALPHHQQFWRPEFLMDDAERAKWADGNIEKVIKQIGDLLEDAIGPLRKLDSLMVPCGGGVDSTLLGAYLNRNATGRLRFLTINKVDNEHQEKQWMDSISTRLKIPLEYIDVTRENFFQTYFDFLQESQQPAIGPNLVAHRLLRRRAQEMGETQFVTGELCDTVFGGMSSFSYTSPQFRFLQRLQKLPKGLRFWIPRAMSGERELFMEIMQVARGEELGRIAGADLERAEAIAEVAALESHVSGPQHMADLATWLNLRLVPNYLHNAFFEYDENPGGETYFPFADPAIVRLGVHLPYFLKRRKGSNKWIWRQFAEPYIGHEVAFRKKDTFPSPIHLWFDKAMRLLPNGFLEDLLCARIGDLLPGMGPHDPSRWTLVNLELWGRIHCLGQEPSQLMGQVV